MADVLVWLRPTRTTFQEIEEDHRRDNDPEDEGRQRDVIDEVPMLAFPAADIQIVEEPILPISLDAGDRCENGMCYVWLEKPNGHDGSAYKFGVIKTSPPAARAHEDQKGKPGQNRYWPEDSKYQLLEDRLKFCTMASSSADNKTAKADVISRYICKIRLPFQYRSNALRPIVSDGVNGVEYDAMIDHEFDQADDTLLLLISSDGYAHIEMDNGKHEEGEPHQSEACPQQCLIVRRTLFAAGPCPLVEVSITRSTQHAIVTFSTSSQNLLPSTSEACFFVKAFVYMS